MPRQSSTISPNTQNVYVGIDVHLKHWNVCVYYGGICCKKFQQSPDPIALLSYLQSNYPNMTYNSAYEAGICGCSVHYALKEVGINNIIFHAADVSQTHKERVRKTDSIDAAKIARSLAHGELRCVHIPPPWRIEDRNLLRLRQAKKSDVQRNKSRVRHFLHVNGIKVPEQFASRRWTDKFFEWLYKTADSRQDNTGVTLSLMTKYLENMCDELKAIEKKLSELMKTERYASDYALLDSIPGIGTHTITALLLECGDLSEFKSSEAFCAYVGLIPDMHQSGEHNGKCSITQRRHKSLRYMLTECAWRVIRFDDSMGRLYGVYFYRYGSKCKAIVRVAHKIAKIIKCVLKNKTPYVSPDLLSKEKLKTSSD